MIMLKIKELAFTLIELLVVIAVIGILSGLIVVSMNGTTQKATITKAQVFSNSLRNALMLNMVSEWKFNNNVIDSWGGNNGNATGSPIYGSSSQCIFDQCLSFDGSDDYVSISSSQTLAMSKTTISLWIYPRDLNTWRGLIYIYENGLADYLVIRSNGSALQLLIEDDNLTKVDLATPSIETNKWSYLTFVQNGTSWKYYKNGKEELLNGTNSSYCTNHLSINTIYIGRSAWDAQYFNGMIDDMRIYNESMSSFQIKKDYYLGLNSLLVSRQLNVREYVEEFNFLAKALDNN